MIEARALKLRRTSKRRATFRASLRNSPSVSPRRRRHVAEIKEIVPEELGPLPESCV